MAFVNLALPYDADQVKGAASVLEELIAEHGRKGVRAPGPTIGRERPLRSERRL